MKKTALFLCMIWYAGQSLIAQQQTPNKSSLTIDGIMSGEDFVGYLPENISWSPDSKNIYFSWNPDKDTLRSMYKVGITEGALPEKMSAEEQMQLFRGGATNADHSAMLITRNGDIYHRDLSTGTEKQLTNTLERESDPNFTSIANTITFVRDNNIFSWNLETSQLTQLSDFRPGKERPEKKPLEYESWLERDQLEYFDILARQKSVREARQRRGELLEPKRPKTIYLGDQNVSNIQASPDLAFVTFTLISRAKPARTIVPNYVTQSGFTEDINARTKVGAPGNTYKMGIYDLQRDTVYYVDTKQIPGIYDKPAFLKDYHKGEDAYQEKYDKPREVIIAGPVFSQDSKAVVVVRSLDNKDRWIMQANLSDGSLELLDRQHDEAWIGGPGIGWTASAGNLGWMPDGKNIWFQSEESGYSHLYTIEVDSKSKKALTSGPYEVLDAFLSKDKTHFYLTANAEGPHEQHFYRLPLEGGTPEKITSLPGGNQVVLSPDEQYLAVNYSYSNKPWELYVMENKPGAEMRQLTHSTTESFENYTWRAPEIVWFEASDGVKVPARIYRPAKTRKNGPAVMFVHGAGYLQNVHQWWSSYYREYMFHNLLADNGFTVLDIDYRASAGYGRDWRTAIYRYMGGRDLGDYIDGAKFLTEKHGVDPGKIGIYGGSYGGFMTLMGLFTSPGTFKSGAALRSVTDWAHYNHPYTANILNTPVEDSLAYYRSSPIYHAEGLKDQLLILHGMVDTNVHFQDVVRLAQRLIELRKENWEFAVFPMENHGFVEATSWADEYSRIYKLFYETLKE